jgi:hypothetical protein
MSFSMMRKITVDAQLGPFETFSELQSAAATEHPGTVLIRPDPKGFPKQTLKSGDVHDAQGHIVGTWKED